MSRTMPVDCPHGVTIDWGDFGPCQDCCEHGDDDCPNLEDCPECTDVRSRADALLDRMARAEDVLLGLAADADLSVLVQIPAVRELAKAFVYANYSPLGNAWRDALEATS